MTIPVVQEPELVQQPEEALFVRLRELPEGSRERTDLREQLIRSHLPLVRTLAARFEGRGEAREDLFQVGMIGLIKAVDRFEPDRGTRFEAYATPTVVGELKRHFRDHGWAIRPPRRIQELRAEIKAVRYRLAQRMGRSPRTRELAEELGRTEEEVIEAIAAGDNYQTFSLDRPIDDDPDGATWAETLGAEDTALEFIERRESVRCALGTLSPRESRILLLRFYGSKNQREIAEEIGISQMHVSRLITKTLTRLRHQIMADPPPA